MKRLLAAVSLAVVVETVAACGSNPVEPEPPGPQPQAIYTVSGIVTAETSDGLMPIEGVQVLESRSGRNMTTGPDGLYSLPNLYGPANASIQASKFGYQLLTKTFMISEDTRLDILIVEAPSYTLSGIVFERTLTGTAPIAAVQVYCDSCGSPEGHTLTYTDAEGRYSFKYAYPGAVPLLIRKEGYGDPAGQPPGRVPGWLSRQAIVIADTHTVFDIELARLQP
jgi:hypothetical protein